MTIKLTFDKTTLAKVLSDDYLEDASNDAAPIRPDGRKWELARDPVVDAIHDGKVYVSVDLTPYDE